MGIALFILLAGLLIASAAGVVLNRHPVRSAMCLVATLFLLAVFFILLNADFVAGLQIVVYAGAIMVLFLFVIMLLNLQDEPGVRRRRGWQITAIFTASLLALALIVALREAGVLLPGPGTGADVPAGFGSTETVAMRLFTGYLLHFEITGLLMLAAVVGAVVLARKKVS